MVQTAPMNRKWFAGFIPTAKQLFATLALLIVTGLVTAHFARGTNLEVAIRQQQLTDIQKFQTSATEMDTSFQAFNDALVDSQNIESSRSRFRAAIAHHASDTWAMQNLFGEKRARVYIDHLAHLRDLIDSASDPTNAIPMAQAALDAISERQKMVSDAQEKIGVKEAGS